MTENPYTAPQSAPELVSEPELNSSELASRWARLGASILDVLVITVVAIPIIGLAFYFGINSASKTLGVWFYDFSESADSPLWQAINCIFAVLVYIAINGYLLVKSGQTIGKKALSIQIVDYQTNQLLSVGKVIGLRYVVTQVLYNIPFFSLIDILFIFGSEKRCIHDYIARSKVIKKPHG